MITLPMDVQKRMTKAWFEVLKPGGNMLQYTYSLISPLPESKLGLKGRRKGIAFLNVPPAWVWSYEKINVAPSAA
jgi:phosphatidylethanolamine/phosphatidyl-N-methylethanolamine N-methyltransferase